ncbi:unnamed protein product, partial [Ectocarpus sp. 6 AP-2014]
MDRTTAWPLKISTALVSLKKNACSSTVEVQITARSSAKSLDYTSSSYHAKDGNKHPCPNSEPHTTCPEHARVPTNGRTHCCLDLLARARFGGHSTKTGKRASGSMSGHDATLTPRLILASSPARSELSPSVSMSWGSSRTTTAHNPNRRPQILSVHIKKGDGNNRGRGIHTSTMDSPPRE